MLVLLLYAYAVLHQRKSRGERPPIQDKLLRLAGHTLSHQIERAWEQFTHWVFAATVFSGCLANLLSQTNGKETTAYVGITVLLFGLSAAICTVFASRKISTLRPLRLGLLGEQAVAEQLQTLSAHGYLVFHDIPGDGKWNIDHAVVGPAGVFAIETKCRAKRSSTNGLRDQDAIFDGDMIQFPWCKDRKSVEQARRNAKWLAGRLAEATGEKVTVQGIVALPGWWVTLKAKSDVKVLSGKQVSGFIAGEPPILPAKLIQQIAYQLEQRCRDVEF